MTSDVDTLKYESRIVELECALLELIKSADAYSQDDPPKPTSLAELQETIKRAADIVFKEMDGN